MVDTNTSDTSSGSGATPTDQQKLSLRPIILEQGFDTESGFPGLVTSSDNGKTNVLEYTADGKVYRQRDADRIWKYIMPKVTKYTTAGGLWIIASGDLNKYDSGLYYLSEEKSKYQNLAGESPGILSVLRINGKSWQTYVTLTSDAAMYYRASPDGETWQKWQKLGAGGGSGGGGKTTNLDDGTDLNAIKDNGTYSSDAVTLNNGPLSASDMMGHFWILNVSFSADGTYGVQKMMCDSGDEYARFYVSSTWRDWSHATYFD